MNERDARDFFSTLAVDERLRLLRDIISDIEGKLQRDQEAPGLELFSIDDLPAVFESPWTSELPEISLTSDLNIHGLTGGSAENINKLRLVDAVEHLRGLLKKYGYVQGLPAPAELARLVREAEIIARRKGRRSAWSEWVARDQETPDRPASHDWESWVTKADEEAEAKKTE